MILPQPDAHFEWIDPLDRPALICRPLVPFARHLFTSRGWPLGSGAADDGKWAEVARAVETTPTWLLRAHQVHGTAHVAHHVGQPIRPADDADIVMSGDRQVAV